MAVNQEGVSLVCLLCLLADKVRGTERWSQNTLLEPCGALASTCTTAPLRAPRDLKRLFESWLIVGLSVLVLLECTKHGRKYHPQRKCGCAVARSLKRTTERLGVHSFHVSVWTMSDHGNNPLIDPLLSFFHCFLHANHCFTFPYLHRPTRRLRCEYSVSSLMYSVIILWRKSIPFCGWVI